MQRNVALAAGLAAGALAALLLRRGRRTEPGAAPPVTADPRAEELRRKLAQARETAADEDDFEAAGMAGETTVAEGEVAPRPRTEDVDETRRRVHERGRSAADEMRRGGEAGEA